MKTIHTTFFLFFIVGIANAQLNTSAIFGKTSQAIKSLRSIRYNVGFTQKNPFSKGDVSVGVKEENVIFNPDGTVKYMLNYNNVNAGQIIYGKVYSGGKLYSTNLIDSTYTVEVPKSKISYKMADIAMMMASELKANPKKIIRKADTIYNGNKVYDFLIKKYDTISNGNHDFTHAQVLVDQKTMLPVYLKETGAGSTFKGGILLGRLEFYEEVMIYDVLINKNIKIMPFDSSGFSLPNTKMLDNGDTSPPLSLKSISGTDISPASFKNKLLLVVFGATSCPANPLANPVLNRLHAKFSANDFSVVNIYTSETSEQVKKYIESNNLKFPVYIGERKLGKDFQTLGTPNFYLIGRDGKIVRSSDGYSENLEANMTEDIVKILGTKL